MHNNTEMHALKSLEHFPPVAQLADTSVSVTTQQVYFPLDGMVYPICCFLSTSWTFTYWDLSLRGFRDRTASFCYLCWSSYCSAAPLRVCVCVKCIVKFQSKTVDAPNTRQAGTKGSKWPIMLLSFLFYQSTTKTSTFVISRVDQVLPSGLGGLKTFQTTFIMEGPQLALICRGGKETSHIPHRAISVPVIECMDGFLKRSPPDIFSLPVNNLALFKNYWSVATDHSGPQQ